MRHTQTISKLTDARPHLVHFFRDGEKDYQVIERIAANGNRAFRAYVHFSRITSNVFGNGSRCVLQGGWRELPYGPKRHLLAREAEFSQRERSHDSAKLLEVLREPFSALTEVEQRRQGTDRIATN